MVVAGALYLLFACLRYWPVAPWSSSEVLHHGANDPAQSVWFLAWVAHALAHGQNPFFSHAINVPRGANIATNTATPALGVLMAPLTWVLGPVSAYNVALRLGLAGSALAMFGVLRHFAARWPAAFVGGLLYGFSAFALRESIFHLHLEFLVLPPLLLWAFDELFVAQRRRAVATGAVLGALGALQWLVNEEVLAASLVMAALGLILVALARRHQVGAHLRRAAPGILAALVVGGAAVAYPLWAMVAGPGHLLGPTQPAAVLNGYRVDLLGPLVAGISLTTPLASAQGASPAPVSYVLDAAYLGAPLLLVVVALALWWRRHAVVRFASAMAVIAFLLALGPRLTVDGHVTALPLPAALFAHLPFLDELVPLRFSIFVWLFVAVVVGVGLDRTLAALAARLGGSHARAAPSSSALLGSAALLVALGLYAPVLAAAPSAVASPVPRATAAEAVARLTPPGATVLFLPPIRRTLDEPMVWQAQASMAYDIVGGYVIVARSAYSSTNFPPPTAALGDLYAAFAPVPGHRRAPATEVNARRAAIDLAACRALPVVARQYQVATVALWRPRPHVLPQEALLRRAMGPPAHESGGIALWTRRQLLKSRCGSR